MIRRKALLPVLAVVVSLVAAACGDDGGSGEGPQGTNSPVSVASTLPEGTTQDAPNVISIYLLDHLAPTVEGLLKRFKQENPDTLVETTVGPADAIRERIRAGDRPHLYIDTRAALAELQDLEEEPVPFGTDVLQIAVAAENPSEVSGLDAFAPDSGLRTGLCAAGTPCGTEGRAALRDAGIDVDPQVEAASGPLAGAVARGEVDAALMLRSNIQGRILIYGGIGAVGLPPERARELAYDMVRLRSGPRADAFLDFVQNADIARRTLVVRGMASIAEVLTPEQIATAMRNQ